LSASERSERTTERGTCEGDHCITCSDEAVAVRVIRLRDGDLADVDVGDGRTEEVSVALVDAVVGDTVLVHAKEAIGLVPKP
jgi:hydrogenase maturation factor